MAFESITDEFIEELISCRKMVSNPKTREVVKPGHKQINYIVKALDDSGHIFELFARQNLADGMADDFSCGLRWLAPNGESLIICRYNGSSHPHRNKVENNSLGLVYHIHRVTERYIAANQKPDGFASETDRYLTQQEALHCLLKDCRIEGLTSGEVAQNQIDLFEE
ncbi:MAG: hypothetical protein NT163_02730 [Chlorobiales bacterium]|nr:hypothetical protein [Chlorobiales bacterium]